jgi:hypothetical protein
VKLLYKSQIKRLVVDMVDQDAGLEEPVRNKSLSDRTCKRVLVLKVTIIDL